MCVSICKKVPLHTTGQRRVGQVGRADIGGGESGITVENVRIGVQSGHFGIIRNLDLCVGQFAKFSNGLEVGCFHIGGRDDPQLPTAR